MNELSSNTFKFNFSTNNCGRLRLPAYHQIQMFKATGYLWLCNWSSIIMNKYFLDNTTVLEVWFLVFSCFEFRMYFEVMIDTPFVWIVVCWFVEINTWKVDDFNFHRQLFSILTCLSLRNGKKYEYLCESRFSRAILFVWSI